VSTITEKYQTVTNVLSFLSGIAPLLFRLILAPTLIIAGYSKLGISGDWESWVDVILADPNVVAWFGNPDWGLGLPFPHLLAFLVGWLEFIGGWLILIGLATRFVAVPLMFIMLVAATSVHWENGWFAITPTNPDTSAARVLTWFDIKGSKESLENSIEAGERLSRVRNIVEQHGSPDYLFETGRPVILNNGIEFSAIYFAMLFSLFFTGGGRFTSADYYVKRIVN
jgi:putative oxidoreductase